MKVSGLVAHFLYQRRSLSLPGLGKFYIAENVVVPDIHDKNFREFLQYIQFTPGAVTTDPELIEYIRSQTGKIKPLAEADLEAFIAEGKELLNISKPFVIEGVGMLEKNRNGKLEFSLSEMGDAVPAEPRRENSPMRDNVHSSELTGSRPGRSLKSLVMLAAIVVGLGLIVGAGYLWSTRSSDSGNDQALPPVAPLTSDTTKATQNAITPDSTTLKKDSVGTTAPATTVTLPSGHYKFVFETTNNKSRALRRYKIVHAYNRNIGLETTDSTLFKLYVMIPATPKDTIRIKDSLNGWYWGAKKMLVKIEQ